MSEELVRQTFLKRVENEFKKLGIGFSYKITQWNKENIHKLLKEIMDDLLKF